MAIAALIACDGRTRAVAPGPVAVGSVPTILAFAAPVRAVGPVREVCVDASSENDAARATVRDWQRETDVTAVLIRTDGGRETVGAGGPSHRNVRMERAGTGEYSVCVEDDALASPDRRPVRVERDSTGRITMIHAAEGRPPTPRTATYRAVELASATPVRVLRVRLSAGAYPQPLFP